MIETAHLQLIPCQVSHFEAILTNQERLAQLLGSRVFDNWFDFPGVAGIEAIQFSYEFLKAHPEVLPWWMYLFIHVKDQVLVGYGGYKGRPDETGSVEIGYAIIPAYRGQGLATEAAQGLVDYAFSHPPIRRVMAHTLAEPNASTRVLAKVGMTQIETIHDPDEGEVWRWGVTRAAPQQA